MKYLAVFETYERDLGKVEIINFSAEADEEALKKVFDKKILQEGEFDSDYLEDSSFESLKKFFNRRDVSGEDFLHLLVNRDTSEEVFNMGMDITFSEVNW